MPQSLLHVLSNTPLPFIEGVRTQHFGDCRAMGAKGYRPEEERRSLREILDSIPEGFSPDILLFRSPEYLPIPEDLFVFKGLKILLITDWNVCLRFLPDLCRLFDCCFTDAPGTRILKRAGVENIFHQPLFGHDSNHFRLLQPLLSRDLELSFCGNLNAGIHVERNRLIFRLAHFGIDRPFHLGQAFGEEYLRILNRSQLVFNYSIRGEANMRLYEAMACGATVLVERENVEVPMLFTAGIHYLEYNPQILEQQCSQWLSEPEKLNNIGLAAQEAVSDHTQSKQLRRVFDFTLNLSRGERLGNKITGVDTNTRMSAKKLRLLGVGYHVSEALSEIQAADNELPGITQDTIPGLFLSFLEKAEVSTTRTNVLLQLNSFLHKSKLPLLLKYWFQMHASRMHSDLNDVLNKAAEFLKHLESLEKSDFILGRYYGIFFHPINLGLGMNSDINRCFQKYLEKGHHQTFYEFLKNSALNEAVNACIQLGKINHAEIFVSRMTEGIWHEFSPWPLRFSLAMLRFDTMALPGLAENWLQDNPLNARVWEQILKGFKSLGMQDAAKQFLQQTLPAGRHFMSLEQLQRLQQYL